MLILLLIYKAISQVATTGILFVYCQVWVHGDNLIYWSMQEWNRFAGTYVILLVYWPLKLPEYRSISSELVGYSQWESKDK